MDEKDIILQAYIPMLIFGVSMYSYISGGYICSELLVYCNTYYGGPSFNCCKHAELILDYVYFGCYRLSGFGNQTWPGNAAGITLGIRSQIRYPNFATTGRILDGTAIQILHPSIPYNFEKLNIPGNSMVTINLHPAHSTHIDSVESKCRSRSQNASFFDSNTGCIWKFWLEAYKRYCKCTPFLYAPDPDFPYCNPFNFQLCFKLNETGFKLISDYTISHQQECATPHCESWDYNPILTSQPIDTEVFHTFLPPELKGQNDSFIVAEIFFPKLSYTWTEEIKVYSVDSFISNVGGQLGLWLGVSALTVLQGISYILDFLKTAISQRMTRELKKISSASASGKNKITISNGIK